MKILASLLLIVIVFTSFGTAKTEVSKEANLLAKCAMPTFATARKDSKTIFVGKVLSIKAEGDYKILTFQVEKYWKNPVRKTVEVKHYETYNYEVWLQVGGRYLVYAKGDEDGTLFDGRCSLTKKYVAAKSDLKKLGKGKLPR